eukprot:6201251-Pleurochrysis_carterae.AAC.2
MSVQHLASPSSSALVRCGHESGHIHLKVKALQLASFGCTRRSMHAWCHIRAVRSLRLSVGTLSGDSSIMHRVSPSLS